MSIADWFSFKSKEEREREARKYTRFAFPYGEAQREALAKLIAELLPNEPDTTAMAVFLMGKEGYLGSFKLDAEDREARTEEDKLAGALWILKRQLRGKNAAYIPYYLALVIADAAVGEDLRYPEAEEIRKEAEKLRTELGL